MAQSRNFALQQSAYESRLDFATFSAKYLSTKKEDPREPKNIEINLSILMAVGGVACWLARITLLASEGKTTLFTIQRLAYSGNNAANSRGIPGRF